ncbi:hypothetical protein T265_13699, partial [Opisthorchis viverrini]
MRRPGAAHSVAWKYQKRGFQLGVRLLKILRQPKTGFAPPGTHQQLKHEAALCRTFSCLVTSQKRDSPGFYVSLSENHSCLQISVALTFDLLNIFSSDLPAWPKFAYCFFRGGGIDSEVIECPISADFLGLLDLHMI